MIPVRADDERRHPDPTDAHRLAALALGLATAERDPWPAACAQLRAVGSGDAVAEARAVLDRLRPTDPGSAARAVSLLDAAFADTTIDLAAGSGLDVTA